MRTSVDRDPFDRKGDGPDYGWSIEREPDGFYALYTPAGLRAAPVHWDADGQCWVDWQAREDGVGVDFESLRYWFDLHELCSMLAQTEPPTGLEPRDPP